MKNLFLLVLTILLFIGLMPINSARAEEYTETEEYSEDFLTTISVPIYEDNNVLEFGYREF